MFNITSETEMGGRCHRYAVLRDGEPLPYLEAIDLWQSSGPFRSFFTAVLSDSPFAAYRWETPPITSGTVTRPFEFVLVDSPGLARTADSAAFREHFDSDGQGIVVFENLGGDATMIVPSPRGLNAAYGHLAVFMREAPNDQIHALWKSLGEAVGPRISDRPLWLSTAGGGVAWLHVRLDSRPKYYAYSRYKVAV